MKVVKIYKLENNGQEKIIAKCFLSEDKVICEGDEVFINNLEKIGILDYSKTPPERLFFHHGLRFLEQLKNNFHSAYLFASEVLDE